MVVATLACAGWVSAAFSHSDQQRAQRKRSANCRAGIPACHSTSRQAGTLALQRVLSLASPCGTSAAHPDSDRARSTSDLFHDLLRRTPFACSCKRLGISCLSQCHCKCPMACDRRGCNARSRSFVSRARRQRCGGRRAVRCNKAPCAQSAKRWLAMATRMFRSLTTARGIGRGKMGIHTGKPSASRFGFAVVGLAVPDRIRIVGRVSLPIACHFGVASGPPARKCLLLGESACPTRPCFATVKL